MDRRVSVPTRYFAEASSIGSDARCATASGVVGTTLLAFLARTGLYRHRLFELQARPTA
jgi:hypothetical protein